VPPLLLGLETEYAVAGILANGEREETTEVTRKLLDRIRRTEPHLPDGSAREGMFLRNGGRLYMDCGAHPEFATPEATNPWEAVLYVRAGERLLARSAAEVAERTAHIEELVVLRSNVDYSESETTWGCHESYLHRCDPEILPPQLIPHLVSRVVYSGAGGFKPRSGSFDFTLSPRSWLLSHTKDESLSSPEYHRLHILCGESLCSDLAAVLKVGTTALILAAVEGGERPGTDLALRNPLAALRAFASDPTCKVRAHLFDRKERSALEIQRCYLDSVERFSESERLPPWSGPLCRMWRRTLDLLEEAPESVQTSLDWAIKLALYRKWVEDNLGPDRVREWLRRPVRRTPTGKAPQGEKAQLNLLDWEGFDLARAELFEADLRFGQLGGGIFEDLDRTETLTHRLLDENDVARALHEPPSVGRGKARGELVTRHGGKGLRGKHREYDCDWSSVSADGGTRTVDLADPFTESTDWQTEVAEDEEGTGPGRGGSGRNPLLNGIPDLEALDLLTFSNLRHRTGDH
jgi:hypothetical protein